MNSITKQSILELIGNDQVEQAIELLLAEIPKDSENEVLLQSNRLISLQKDIRMGLVSYQDSTVTKNQIVFGILETIKALEGTKEISVLVAGTGKYQLPNEVLNCAKSIGKKLGENEYKLICGGWEGVDYVVADEFSKVMKAHRKPLSENLVQVIIEDTEPIFKGGNLVYVKKGLKEWIEAIKYADVVVLIGGEGGTYETFLYAQQESRPILPIASTGGDAEKAFHQMMENWEDWEENFLKGISREQFATLLQSSEDETNADKIVEIITQMIKQITG